MGDRVQFVRTLRQHGLGNHQFTHQVNQLINLLYRHADTGGFTAAGRRFFTFSAVRRSRFAGNGFQHGRRGNHRWHAHVRRCHHFRDLNGGFCSRCFSFKGDLVGFNHEAQHRDDIILTDTAIDGSCQAIGAFNDVAQGRQVTQLFFQQIHFTLFQTREHHAQLCFGCRRGRVF
ncbi:hypothetical protein D3C72_1550860 [compost metagenome]